MSAGRRHGYVREAFEGAADVRAVIPQTRKALLEQRARATWMQESERPPWGPGRIDPFNPVKFGFLGINVDQTVGNADNVAIWDFEGPPGPAPARGRHER